MTTEEKTTRRAGWRVSLLQATPGAHEPEWATLYRWGGGAAIAVLALIPVQAVIYMASPPPVTVAGWFALFQRSPLLGLLNFDLLFVVTNVLMLPIFLALYVALRRVAPSLMAIALTFCLIGLAAYFPTNGAFEMWALSRQYAAAATEAERIVALAAGQTMVATFAGMAFNVYYLLNAAAILLISVVMLRSPHFSRLTAYMGIAAGALMVVPSSAGQVGLVMSFLSLLPTVVWLVLVARTFLHLGRSSGRHADAVR